MSYVVNSMSKGNDEPCQLIQLGNHQDKNCTAKLIFQTKAQPGKILRGYKLILYSTKITKQLKDDRIHTRF